MISENLPQPIFAKEGSKKIYLLISPFEKGAKGDFTVASPPFLKGDLGGFSGKRI